MKMLRLSLGALIITAVAGCQAARHSGPTEARLRAMETFASKPIDPDFMKAIGNLTVVSYSPHGPQVSYREAGGQITLWYPGNTLLLKGEWKALVSGSICYKYGANTYNPLTQSSGGLWECELLHNQVGNFRQERKGDIFGLAKRTKPPFVTRRDKTQFDALVAQLPSPSAADRSSRVHDYLDKRRAAANEAIHAKHEEARRKLVEQNPALRDKTDQNNDQKE